MSTTSQLAAGRVVSIELPPAPPPRRLPWPARALVFVVAWAWRIAAGAFLCFNYFILSYVTSIAVFGWSYRWMQGLVLRGLWKRSPKRHEGSFEDFCRTLGPDAPTSRPRWFLRQRIGLALRRPGPGGRPAGAGRTFWRCFSVPWHSLWLNVRYGLTGLFATYLLTGWGCLLMVFGWEFGWDNSFNKGYELAWVGPTMFFSGVLLLALTLFYVPMAQAHQAATGQVWAFFDFRFVRRLVRARLTAYFLLVALVFLASVALNIAVLFSVSEEFPATLAETPEEGLLLMWQYLATVSVFVLFPLFLLTRLVAAAVYRSALLKVLRQGVVSRSELHPTLAGWFDRLDLKVVPLAERSGLARYARRTARQTYRTALLVALFVVCLSWVFPRHAGAYFFRSHPIVGFLNHPMIQMPCFDFIPQHLWEGRNE
jgi:hypothetical protein